ncbi:MAG: hypothetical protein QG562_723, partial [Patescibacteria group bacterium]|nr:hypothetical protein [Patescibacteria group bacterium]
MSELPTQEKLNEQEQMLLQSIALQAIQQFFNYNISSGENNTPADNFLEEFEKKLRIETKEAEANVANIVRTFVEGGKDSYESKQMREVIYQQAQDKINNARKNNEVPEPVDQLIVSIYDEFVSKSANTQTPPEISTAKNEAILADFGALKALINQFNIEHDTDKKNNLEHRLKELLEILTQEKEMGEATGANEYGTLEEIQAKIDAINAAPNPNTQTPPDTDIDKFKENTDEQLTEILSDLEGELKEDNLDEETRKETVKDIELVKDEIARREEAAKKDDDFDDAAPNPNTQTPPDTPDSTPIAPEKRRNVGEYAGVGFAEVARDVESIISDYVVLREQQYRAEGKGFLGKMWRGAKSTIVRQNLRAKYAQEITEAVRNGSTYELELASLLNPSIDRGMLLQSS